MVELPLREAAAAMHGRPDRVPRGVMCGGGGGQSPGRRFSLAEYLKAGYKLTAPMRKFVSEGAESPRLTVAPDSEIPAE